ncbi:CoA transferase subunit A [Amycolatopsis panacis]|uniref:CoA transferase subunit A n=1 Tax=Amycolatopsis panacis TaxID=2340917 RepID=A0A419I9H0_9PSEU|nr:CoA transferase subunit A [Amycolatopsis panacis]RJQ89278.1 CoA transferase subunit A [Amycolatopsis panacis]
MADADEAVADVPDGASVAAGGFGACGIPSALIDALYRHGAVDLHVISNNCGTDGWGLGILLEASRIRRVTASYVGDNEEFARRYLGGELEVELCPQGSLAERLRAGGAGIPAFYTAAGVGTPIAEGGMPWRYAPDGTVAVASPPKPTELFDGVEYVREKGITADFAIVHAALGDTEGNLVFAKSARNFNPLCAMAGQVTIAEVEDLVTPGEIDPDAVHVPGIFVQRVLHTPAVEKRVEKRTVREPMGVS